MRSLSSESEVKESRSSPFAAATRPSIHSGVTFLFLETATMFPASRNTRAFGAKQESDNRSCSSAEFSRWRDLPVSSHWQKSQVCQFFGCCTTDSQADEEQNQCNNNLKIYELSLFPVTATVLPQPSVGNYWLIEIG